jgi:Adenylylsulfate kinase and related kinases
VTDAREPDGPYAKAGMGEIAKFTGIDGPNERPNEAEIVVSGSDVATSITANRIPARLQSHG